MIESGYSKGGQDELRTIFTRKDYRHAAVGRSIVGPGDDYRPNLPPVINLRANPLSLAQTIWRPEDQPGQAHQGYRA